MIQYQIRQTRVVRLPASDHVIFERNGAGLVVAVGIRYVFEVRDAGRLWPIPIGLATRLGEQ